jgi:hypothetical protein
MDLGRGNLAYVAAVGLWTLDHKYVPPYKALGKFNYRIEDAGNAWPAVPAGKPGQLWLIRIETQGTFLDGRSPPPALVETYTYLFQP